MRHPAFAVAAALSIIGVACSGNAAAPAPVAAPPASTVVTTTEPPSTTTLPPTTTTTTLPPTTTTTTLVPDDGLTAAERRLTEVATITGPISPKSVAASGDGLFFAQNMMYRHTITVYDRDYDLVATIPDTVAPADFGHDDFPGEYRGSPVEAAFTSDGRHAYVSNYKMYGGGLSTAASDGCNAGAWPDSFVYRVDAATLQIDRLIRVGPVPKYLALTPDDRTLLVANWCGFDVSVVDAVSGQETARVPVGRHPRGIAVSPDASTAYVAIMGSSGIAVLDLASLEVSTIDAVGRSPRHLVLSPDGRTLYATLNGEGRVAKIDVATGAVLAKVATGTAPRSMAISDDGSALYVVNNLSNTMSKVRTSDMTEIEEHPTGGHPIGIAYDAATREVWVSCYWGTINVFADTDPDRPGAPPPG